jgi:hypothetical protein
MTKHYFNQLFDLDWIDWGRFFGAVMLFSFAAGMAYQGAIVGRDYLLLCP